ncbi:MAG: type I-E CRISPR-associated protein Cas6/Cse3/CasE [Clostridiales bacterium]|nr:type I-E CRISPR-associated protein Cas6/Cse3/CasE [Clostridiales bacterium]
MYLSRVLLNVDRRDTMKALASPQVMHGAVEGSFSDKKERKLWRIDWLNDACFLLVLSNSKPDYSRMIEKYGYSDKPGITKDYEQLLKRIDNNQKWHFRLCANPVRSSAKDKANPTERGKIYAHVTMEQQKEWLLKRSESCGFHLQDKDFMVVKTQWKRFRKGEGGRQEVSLKTATYEGSLTISDCDAFRNTLMSGLGRAKAYGCGLLTIARCGG